MTPGRSSRRPAALVLAALLLSTAGLVGCEIEPAQNAELRRAEAEADLRGRVQEMLQASAAGWNRGDLEAFMAPYARGPETTYVGGTGLRVGYEAVRERYAPLFQPGAARDSLRFRGLRVRSIDSDVAVGVARWELHDGEEVTGAGPFTLVLRRTGDEWRIVHDHSSSDPDFHP